MEFNDLVEGEIYLKNADSKFYPFLFKYKARFNQIGFEYYIDINNKLFYNQTQNLIDDGDDYETISLCTMEDKLWLEECIRQNKYVSKEEALSYFKTDINLDKINDLISQFDGII